MIDYKAKLMVIQEISNDRRVHIDCLETENENLENMFDRVMEELKLAKAKISYLEGEVVPKYKWEYDAKKVQVKELELKIETSTNEAREFRKQVSIQLESLVSSSNSNITDLKNEVADLEGNIADLENEVAEALTEAEEYAEAVAEDRLFEQEQDFKEQVAELCTELDDEKSKVYALEKDMDYLSDENDDLIEDNVALSIRLEEEIKFGIALERELPTKREVTGLEQEVIELKQVIKELEKELKHPKTLDTPDTLGYYSVLLNK